MTKVIKGEFEKLESVKINDVLLTCNTSPEIFNEEFNRMSIMEDDLFTYEVEIAEVTNIPCDLKKEDDSEQQMSHESDNDMEYDPSDVEFTEWLASKIFNYKTMDHYTMKALWIYWARGDDEVELTDEESSDSDDEDEVAKIFRIETNTYEEYKDDWIYAWNKDVPWVHKRPWTKNGVWKEPTLVKHHSLKNKAIMEGMIDEDEESSNKGWRRWDDFDNTNRDNKSKNEMEHEDEVRCELFDDHELLVCTVRRFEMIKYSFEQDEEYVDVKEDKYEDLTSTSEDACRAYQEIFHMMDEGWMVTRAE
ncbi:hypothetical protein Tco_1204468 [Tanacetum coccineum]